MHLLELSPGLLDGRRRDRLVEGPGAGFLHRVLGLGPRIPGPRHAIRLLPGDQFLIGRHLAGEQILGALELVALVGHVGLGLGQRGPNHLELFGPRLVFEPRQIGLGRIHGRGPKIELGLQLSVVQLEQFGSRLDLVADLGEDLDHDAGNGRADGDIFGFGLDHARPRDGVRVRSMGRLDRRFRLGIGTARFDDVHNGEHQQPCGKQRQ